MVRLGKLMISVVMVAIGLGLLVGCGSTETKKSGEKDAFKIGVVLDISGKSSSLGIPERDNVLMVVNKINKSGGINGHPIELVLLDNKSNETEAAMAARNLIQKGVLAIVGSSTSGTTLAMLDATQRAQVPLVSAAASVRIVEPVQDRQWVFKTAQSDSLVAEKIIKYLKSKGINKVAFVSMNNAYGDSGRAEFEKLADQQGITIVAKEKFDQDETTMTPQLTRVRKAQPQAVICWAIPPSASSFTVSFRQMGLQMPLIHSHGIGNEKFIELSGDAANGVVFPIGKLVVAESLADADPQKATLIDYIKEYEGTYGPRNPFGGYASDAITLVTKAIEKAGPDRAKIRQELENATNFVGVTGVFNMSAQDHNGLTLDSLTMVEIKDGKWVVAE